MSSPPAERRAWLCRRGGDQQALQLALAWLATGTVLGAVLPILGLAVIIACNAFYWLPIRGETTPLRA